MTLPQQLDAKIHEIRITLDEAKSSGYHLNEAQTEFIIIDPLLHILGYGPLQIYKRGHDSVANNYPDYTLLPNTPHTWFLEVKRLDLTLHDGEAAQAVNYANNQGAEWAVLTNGRTWYIYNAHLPKPLTEKRVIQIGDIFADSQAIEKLLLISRPSMQDAGLTRAWIHERVTAVVKAQLESPNSAIHKHLRKLASEEIGVSLNDAAISQAIASCGLGGLAIGKGYSADSARTAARVQRNGTGTTSPHAATQIAAPAVFHSFAEIAKNATLAVGRKPRTLRFSDGEEEDVRSWAEAASIVVERIGTAYRLPALPFRSGEKGNNFFLSLDKVHKNNNPMLSFQIAKVHATTVYIDTKRSAPYIAASINAFLTAAGAPPEAVKVSVR